MRLSPLLRNFFDLDIVRNNWRLLTAFSAGVILTSIIVESAYVKSLIDKAVYPPSIADPIMISGDWFYRTETSNKPLEYKDSQGNIIKCTSIQGEATITQEKDSYEFKISGLRRVCIDNETTKRIKRNIAWDTINATIIPRDRTFIIKLKTDDNRLGFITGTISKRASKKPDEFRGSMYYLNVISEGYQTSTIKFCKSTTDCAKDILNTIK